MDVTKVPKEVISELFESSEVRRVLTDKLKETEFIEKSTITAGEILSYLKAVANESKIITFGVEKDRLSKLISKLHRYLSANLTTYKEKCSVVIQDIAEVKNSSETEGKELIESGQYMTLWQDIKGQESSMFYILGSLHESAVPKPEEGEDQSEVTDLVR